MKRRDLLLALALAAAALAPAPAGAADPEHRTVIRPGPSLEHWTLPTQLIDRSQLRDAGADLPAVLDGAPGLHVTRTGAPGAFSLLSVRGSTADQVLVFVDGIPLNSAEGGPVDLATLPLGPISAVAVYRGLSPVLLGSSAIGGVVDVRTRQLRGHRLEVEGGLGSFGTTAARAFYGHGDATSGVGVSVDYQGSAGDFGYLHDGGTSWDPSDDALRPRRNNASDQLAAMAKAQIDLGAGARLTLLDLFTHKEAGLPGVGLYETERAHLAQSRNILGARLESLAGPVQLAATAFLSWSRTALDDPLAEIGLGTSRARDASWVPGLTAALRAPLGAPDAPWRLTPMVVLGWRVERYEPGATDGPTADAPGASRHVLTAATEATLGAAPLDAELTVSARYEGAFSATDDGARASTEGGSFRAALTQTSLPDTRLTLAATRNLRLPSLYELYGDTGYVLGNPALRPERGTGLELGVRHDALGVAGGRLSLELAGFVNMIDDLIQLVQNSQGVARPENVDSGRIAGVELGASFDGWQHLRLSASATWLDAIDTSDIPARRGKRLPFRPTWRDHSRLELYHDFHGGLVGEVGVRFEVDHVSGNALDHANLVQVPARVLLGLGAHARLFRDAVRLDVAVRNLTDNRVQDLSGFPLPGLSAMATLSWTPALEEDGQ